MDSNKHATMEKNEEHIMMNILIYYTHKTEQHTWSYDAVNMDTFDENLKTWQKIIPSEI